MKTKSLAWLLTFSLATAAPTFAYADTDTPAPAPAPAPAAVAVAAEAPAVVAPSTQTTGRGVGFGFENGLFGRAFEQGVRIRFPIARYFAFNLRGISTLGATEPDPRWELGGRVELIGHSPIFLNLVRLYGGGGPEIAARVSGPGEKEAALGGGGHFGFEFFLNPHMSFFTEIGGHAGNEVTAGGTVLAGMMLYPFTGP